MLSVLASGMWRSSLYIRATCEDIRESLLTKIRICAGSSADELAENANRLKQASLDEEFLNERTPATSVVTTVFPTISQFIALAKRKCKRNPVIFLVSRTESLGCLRTGKVGYTKANFLLRDSDPGLARPMPRGLIGGPSGRPCRLGPRPQAIQTAAQDCWYCRTLVIRSL